MGQDARAVLEKAVLDPAFAMAVKTDAAAALAGFELTAEEEAAFAAGDAGVLAMMGFVQASDTALGPAGAPPADNPSLQIRLLFRVLFSVFSADGTEAEIHFAPLLSLIEADSDPKTLPPPDPETVSLPGKLSGMSSFELRLSPGLTMDQTGGLTVGSPCAVMPISGVPAPPQTTASADCRAEVSAVRAAGADRMEALAALLAALDGDTYA